MSYPIHQAQKSVYFLRNNIRHSVTHTGSCPQRYQLHPATIVSPALWRQVCPVRYYTPSMSQHDMMSAERGRRFSWALHRLLHRHVAPSSANRSYCSNPWLPTTTTLPTLDICSTANRGRSTHPFRRSGVPSAGDWESHSDVHARSCPQ